MQRQRHVSANVGRHSSRPASRSARVGTPSPLATMPSMSRLERLINLTATLLETERPLTRDQLVELVPGYKGEPGSVRRAFERDKETLRELGVPIELVSVDPLRQDSPQGYLIPKSE